MFHTVFVSLNKKEHLQNGDGSGWLTALRTFTKIMEMVFEICERKIIVTTFPIAI